MSAPDPWALVDEPDPGAYLRPDEHEKQALLDGPRTGPESTQVDQPSTSDLLDDAILSLTADENDGMGISAGSIEKLEAAIRSVRADLDQANAAIERAQAVRNEIRAAYLAGARDEHHPDL